MLLRACGAGTSKPLRERRVWLLEWGHCLLQAPPEAACRVAPMPPPCWWCWAPSSEPRSDTHTEPQGLRVLSCLGESVQPRSPWPSRRQQRAERRGRSAWTPTPSEHRHPGLDRSAARQDPHCSGTRSWQRGGQSRGTGSRAKQGVSASSPWQGRPAYGSTQAVARCLRRGSWQC